MMHTDIFFIYVSARSIIYFSSRYLLNDIHYFQERPQFIRYIVGHLGFFEMLALHEMLVQVKNGTLPGLRDTLYLLCYFM